MAAIITEQKFFEILAELKDMKVTEMSARLFLDTDGVRKVELKSMVYRE